ncbi:MAG TPA: HepT-like ribonuclease domain-containing protein [Candidatus Nanoarchaeia archaeon]|nr:HepT-like ribonuclease domain-containing protein [Candidatus Nanoarchaeia archaeon]
MIGEAAKYLPNDIKDKYTEIDWKSMTGMRDRLIHAYFGIDYKLVWSAIKIEIPKLKLKLKKMMATIEKDGQE